MSTHHWVKNIFLHATSATGEPDRRNSGSWSCACAGTLIVDNVPSGHQITSRTPPVHTLLATHVAMQQHQEANANGVRHDSTNESRFGSEQLKLRAKPADKQAV